MFKKFLSIRFQILGLMFMQLSLLSIAIGIAIFNLFYIGEEINAIAHEDIVLTKHFTKTTIYQLEQGILFEQALQFVGKNSVFTQEESATQLGQIQKQYIQLGNQIHEKIKQAQNKTIDGIEHNHHANSKEQFQKMLQKLKQIEIAHQDFQMQASKLFSIVMQGNTALPKGLIQKLQEQEKQQMHTLENLLLEMEDFTESSLLLVSQHEQSAITLMWFIGTIAILLGVGVGWFVVRRVLTQMGGEPTDIVSIAEKVTQGNLTFDFQSKPSPTGIYASLQLMSNQLQKSMSQVASVTTEVASGANQISSSSQYLASSVSQQAASLEQISSSMTEMEAQTQQNEANATHATQLASSVCQKAIDGKERMSAMIEAMKSIQQASQEISKIIKVIDEIAFQTNLLALNAAVEAARAGIHGKGFSVVADEVRNLAVRSANAAQETSHLIEGSVEKVNYGTEIAEKTSDSLDEVVTGIIKVSDLIAEIDHSSKEQSEAIYQTHQGISQLEKVTQQNAASSEQGAATSIQLAEQAKQLKAVVNQFKLRKTQKKHVLPPPPQNPINRLPNIPKIAISPNISPSQTFLDDEEFGKF